MKGKIRKIADCPNSKHPEHIKPGTVIEGEYYGLPIVGQPFYIGNTRTSKVTEIISPIRFKTLNSIYEFILEEPASPDETAEL